MHDDAQSRDQRGSYEIDLSAEPIDFGRPAEPNLIPLEQDLRPFDPRPAREKMRGRIAFALVGILAFIIIAAFATIWLGSLDVQNLLDLLPILITPIVGLVGAVTGFYYGGKPEGGV